MGEDSFSREVETWLELYREGDYKGSMSEIRSTSAIAHFNVETLSLGGVIRKYSSLFKCWGRFRTIVQIIC